MNKEKIILAICLVLFLDIFLIREATLLKTERLVFCDVGQGDGAFINLKGGTQIIVDGGPDNKLIGCVGKYMPYFDHRIEYLIISHPDKDHFVGAIEILRRYDVKRVFVNGDTSDIPEYAEFLKLAADKINVAYTDSDIILGNMKIDFLYPYSLARETKDNNGNSLVFQFEYAGKNILFTGDLPEKGEQELIKNKADLPADILKVAHHGSKNSSSVEFLKAVRPKLAIISAGKDNDYGHPHYRVLKNLENLKIKYLRTDEKGNIVVNF